MQPFTVEVFTDQATDGTVVPQGEHSHSACMAFYLKKKSLNALRHKFPLFF